jgi:hypothetical protein
LGWRQANPLAPLNLISDQALRPHARAAVRIHLENILFSPTGLLQFLKVCLETERVEPHDSAPLAHFYDSREVVRRALAHFEHLDRENRTNFPRDFRETLWLVGMRKFDIETFVNELISGGARNLDSFELHRIREFIAGAEEVNRVIAQLDSQIGLI